MNLVELGRCRGVAGAGSGRPDALLRPAPSEPDSRLSPRPAQARGWGGDRSGRGCAWLLPLGSAWGWARSRGRCGVGRPGLVRLVVRQPSGRVHQHADRCRRTTRRACRCDRAERRGPRRPAVLQPGPRYSSTTAAGSQAARAGRRRRRRAVGDTGEQRQRLSGVEERHRLAFPPPRKRRPARQTRVAVSGCGA